MAKSGRIRCGVCRRVLDDPARRQARASERAHLETLTGIEKGRALFAYAKPRRDRVDSDGRQREELAENGNPTLVCKCGKSYTPPNVRTRQLDAADRGEDLYLTRDDTTRRNS